MIFGDTDVKNASGCMLAHAINLNALKFPKGHTLSEADCKELYRNGINVVKVARLEDFDISENDAALIIAQAICSHEKIGRISIKRSRTGRVNLVAEQAGVVRLEKQAIVDANMVDHMITIATVPDFQQIKKGGLIATIKIISYAVDKNSVQKFCRLISGSISFYGPKISSAALVVTYLDDQKEKIRIDAIKDRLINLNTSLEKVIFSKHSLDALAKSLANLQSELILILTASATSDYFDIAPEAIRMCGGTVGRFGMPVDPGNLLFLGDLKGSSVIGLPGCARSPAINGADWVLSRIACGFLPDEKDFAEMSIGGLLKEMKSRPSPRRKGEKNKA